MLDEVGETVAKCEHDYQRYHVLSFDEIIIRKNLVYRKSDGVLIGYAKLDEAQREYEELDRMISDEFSGVFSPSSPAPPIASKILTYMVKGVSNSVRHVVASFPGASLKKEDLFYRTWEVIAEL